MKILQIQKFYKFKMADGRQVENQWICPINTKFGMKKQIMLRHEIWRMVLFSWQKINKNFAI